MSTLNIQCVENWKQIPELLLFASGPCTMINSQWLELLMSRTIFWGPKDVRAIEVRLYLNSVDWAIKLQLKYMLWVLIWSASFLMSTHHVCFHGEIRKILHRYNVPSYLELCVELSFYSPQIYRGSYTSGHFIWILWNSSLTCFINFIWNDYKCKILFITWPF